MAPAVSSAPLTRPAKTITYFRKRRPRGVTRRSCRRSSTGVARMSNDVSVIGVSRFICGPPLFDHLICPEQQQRRDGDPDGLGALEIDDQLVLARWFDGKGRRVGAAQDFIDVD